MYGEGRTVTLMMIVVMMEVTIGVDEDGCRSASEFPQPGFYGLRKLLRDFKNTS